MALTQEILGTIPGWITSAGVLGILGLVVRWQLGLKKIDVEAEQVRVSARQVDNADKADERDHIAEEMGELRKNIANLRTELHDCEEECRKRLTECEEECRRTQGISEARARALEEELWGEKRQRVQEQISLINVILRTVDAPELKTLLRAMESARTHLIKERPE